MTRVNVYIPDDLAEQARSARLNVSSLAQDAIRRELSRFAADNWVDRVAALPALDVSHDEALMALEAARDEMGEGRG